MLNVKGTELSLVDLLVDRRLADALEGGPYLVVYPLYSRPGESR